MAASSSAAAPADTYDIPWVEKYRPTRVADVVGNSDAVARLQVIARDGNMPNLILSVSDISSNALPARSTEWRSSPQFPLSFRAGASGYWEDDEHPGAGPRAARAQLPRGRARAQCLGRQVAAAVT